MEDLVNKLRKSFNSRVTRSYEWRRKQLEAIESFCVDNEAAIAEALNKDMKKPAQETIAMELNLIRNSVAHAIRNLPTYMAPQTASLPLMTKPLYSAQTQYEPLGVSLIIGAWNYPYQLTLVPLIGAVASGNCAIVKPSELTEHTAKLMADLWPKYFDESQIALVNGAVKETTDLLNQRFDHIFYTGSTQVGKIVYQAAAKHMTPCTLECGGKSPVFVDTSADLNITAKRIMWGRMTNCGQTCVAPDYVLCTKEVQDKLVEHMRQHLLDFYGEEPKDSDSFSRIVNGRHFERIAALIDQTKVVIGGKTDPVDDYVSPTVMANVTGDDKVMQEEIFGPILPIVCVKDKEEAIEFINSRDKPLALYVFTSDASVGDAFRQWTSSGTMAINEVLMQICFEGLPFGGVGPSGLGAYHGHYSIDCFSHKRSVLKAGFVGESLSYFRYPPGDAGKLKMATMATLTESKRGCNIM